jgi:hypothetical protein
MTRIRDRLYGERGEVSLDAVIVIVVVVIAVVLVLTKPGVPDGPPHVESQTTPEVPSNGQYVETSISAAGALEVTHWISAPRLVSSLLLAPSVPASPGPATLENVVVSAGGATLATRFSLGRGTHEVSLNQPVRQFTITYRVAPAASGAIATVHGRALTFVPGLRIDYHQDRGTVRRTITTPNQILNVACVRADTPPRPCGMATSDGWQVDLAGEDRDDGLLVQTQEPH